MTDLTNTKQLMDNTKQHKIKPFETTCPRCSEEQITSQLNFSKATSGTMEGQAFIQNHIKCNKCGYWYSWQRHLNNPKYNLELIK